MLSGGLSQSFVIYIIAEYESRERSAAAIVTRRAETCERFLCAVPVSKATFSEGRGAVGGEVLAVSGWLSCACKTTEHPQKIERDGTVVPDRPKRKAVVKAGLFPAEEACDSCRDAEDYHRNLDEFDGDEGEHFSLHVEFPGGDGEEDEVHDEFREDAEDAPFPGAVEEGYAPGAREHPDVVRIN